MKKIKLLTGILSAALLAAFSFTAVFAETYHIQDGLKYMLDDGKAYIAGIEDERTTLDIPAEIDGYPLTATTMYFARSNTNLESVTFENAENISIVGSYGFFNCTSLKSAKLGSYITELYRGIFRGCTSLETVELSEKLTAIPYECFYGCSSLGEITLGRNITSIQPNSFTGCSNLVIRCYYNSYAYQYAKENNINYTLLDGVKLGDVDGDGDITITDATAVQRYLAELDVLDDIHLYAADANGDGDVDISDATAIQMAVASIPTGYPIGEVITK